MVCWIVTKNLKYGPNTKQVNFFRSPTLNMIKLMLEKYYYYEQFISDKEKGSNAGCKGVSGPIKLGWRHVSSQWLLLPPALCVGAGTVVGCGRTSPGGPTRGSTELFTWPRHVLHSYHCPWWHARIGLSLPPTLFTESSTALPPQAHRSCGPDTWNFRYVFKINVCL